MEFQYSTLVQKLKRFAIELKPLNFLNITGEMKLLGTCIMGNNMTFGGLLFIFEHAVYEPILA